MKKSLQISSHLVKQGQLPEVNTEIKSTHQWLKNVKISIIATKTKKLQLHLLEVSFYFSINLDVPKLVYPKPYTDGENSLYLSLLS